MKKLLLLFLGSILAVSATSCGAAKTSNEAPNTTAQNNTNLEKPVAQTNQNDATDVTRRKQLNADIRAAEQRNNVRKQLNADIRAAEQRNNVAGDKSVKTDNDLKSEVRSKLEANLPASSLAISAKDGAITVAGTVVDEKQLQKIEPLAKQIGGVKSVNVKASISSAAKPAAPDSATKNPIPNQTGKN